MLKTTKSRNLLFITAMPHESLGSISPHPPQTLAAQFKRPYRNCPDPTNLGIPHFCFGAVPIGIYRFSVRPTNNFWLARNPGALPVGPSPHLRDDDHTTKDRGCHYRNIQAAVRA